MNVTFAERLRELVPDYERRLRHKLFTRGRHNDARFIRWPLDDVRFTRQVWPGDTLTARGEVTDVTEASGQKLATIKLTTVNQNGEPVVEGEAVAAI